RAGTCSRRKAHGHPAGGLAGLRFLALALPSSTTKAARNRPRNECNRQDRRGAWGGAPQGDGARAGAGGAGLHGRRVRRHRHEPALYAECRRQVRQSVRTNHAGSGARHRVAHLLVADRRHLVQIRDPHHARRQSRRGRHSGAAGAGEPAPRQAKPLAHAVVPLTVVILVGLFLIQRNGTSFIGGLFGPVMLIWFIVAGVLGVVGIVRAPAVLAALNPLAAVTYLWHAGPLAFVVIGGAFLAVTGGEAFYADMGHFGPLPIRVAWFGVALPALTLNYFGQGGLLLAEPNSPDVLDSPFYALAPQWAHFPLIVLATVATVIASQSIISGAYSMTQQAISLGFLPRMRVVHTEGREIGQIYVPFVNWALALGTLTAVIGFGSSDALAGAFGIAVSLLMVITTLMATFVALHWKHNRFLIYAVNGSLLALDLLFFASTSTKLVDGGWFPLLIS